MHLFSLAFILFFENLNYLKKKTTLPEHFLFQNMINKYYKLKKHYNDFLHVYIKKKEEVWLQYHFSGLWTQILLSAEICFGLFIIDVFIEKGEPLILQILESWSFYNRFFFCTKVKHCRPY